jgi:hypothetical protein
MLLTTCTAYPSIIVLSTAWMSLDWLIQAWGTFDAEPAGTVPALPGVEQIAIRLTGFGKATGLPRQSRLIHLAFDIMQRGYWRRATRMDTSAQRTTRKTEKRECRYEKPRRQRNSSRR